tara:strand:- start:869 stop:1117 length:249 start_codon:yes stop_codon:yes gene_type:complete
MTFYSTRKAFKPPFEKGDVVSFNGQTDDQRRFGGHDDANSCLTVGDTYVVEKVEVAKWYTKVTLENLDGRFNSACFRLAGVI